MAEPSLELRSPPPPTCFLAPCCIQAAWYCASLGLLSRVCVLCLETQFVLTPDPEALDPLNTAILQGLTEPLPHG